MSSRPLSITFALYQDKNRTSPNSKDKVLPGFRGTELVLLAGFLMLCAGLASSPCQAANDWKKFSPETGISVYIPGKVETVYKDGKTTGPVDYYKSVHDNYLFQIAIERASDEEAVLDDIVKEVRDGLLKDDYKNSTTPVDASGKEWAGKRFQLTAGKGESDLSMQIALDNEKEDLVSLNTTAPLDSPEAKRFFDSLQIDPEAIKAQRIKRGEEALKKFFAPTNVAGWCGLIFSVVGAGACMIGTVCMIVIAFRTSLIWGLAMFIPGGLGSLLFILFNFQRAWPVLALQIFGIITIGIGCALVLPGLVASP